MFDVILKATDSYFQKGVTFCRSIYVKKVNMKLLAFIFEQPSYVVPKNGTVQLLICNTPSVYKTNAKVISIKENALKCTQMYHVCTLYCYVVPFMEHQVFNGHRTENEISYAYNNDDFSSN